MQAHSLRADEIVFNLETSWIQYLWEVGVSAAPCLSLTTIPRMDTGSSKA